METEAVAVPSKPLPEAVPAPSPGTSWPKQFWIILRLQYSDYREFAVQLVLFSLLMPIGFQLLLGAGLEGGEGSSWFLAGTVIMAVAFGNASFVLFRTGQLKLSGQLDYYATLPIGKSSFVTALFVLGQLSSMPGMVASLLVGHWWLQVPWENILVSVPIALGASVCLTVVGSALGSAVRNYGQLNLMSNLLYFITIFLAPVLTPVERMWAPFQFTSYVLPIGQAVLALGDAMVGNYGVRFWQMVGGLGLWLVLAFTVGLRHLDLRNE